MYADCKSWGNANNSFIINGKIMLSEISEFSLCRRAIIVK